MKKDKKQKIALFRFGVISGILNVKETEKGEREKRIGEVTSKEWDIPYSGRSYIGRSTVRDWLKSYEESSSSIESLFPLDRCDQGKTRCMDEESEAAPDYDSEGTPSGLPACASSHGTSTEDSAAGVQRLFPEHLQTIQTAWT